MPAEAAHEILRVLAACRGIELAMAGLYQTLAEIHSHDDPMARLWRKTACEEANHAAQFSLLIESMPDAVVATTVETQALENLRLAVESMAEEYRVHPPSVRDALVALIDFEETMDQLHADQVPIFLDERHTRLFQAMMAADSGHVAKLRAALTKLGSTRP